MTETLVRAAYALLLRLALPAYFARLWWRGRREPAYRAHWGERLGFAPANPSTGRLWLHAVSLGETHAAAPLIAALRARRPGLRLLLTHGTATGREAGARLLREGDAQVWLPYDTPGAVRRFLRAHRPVVGVLMETEIWPALLAEAEAAGVPMVLANARLSARSAAKGLRLRALLHPALTGLACVLAQTEADAARLREAGARGVAVMGNLKFDLAPDPQLLARGREWRGALVRPVVLAASTREGEEAPLLQAWSALPAPRPLLLLVPRHPQRFDEVAAMVAAAGFSLQRRSSFGERPPVDAAAADVWLGDSLGEMALYFALADVALLGGSFAPLGGHNLIEAAACGCPLLMGPHTFNFALAAELSLAAGAAERVADIDAAVQRGAALAHDTAARAAMSALALDVAGRHRGAAERMAQAVLDRLRR
ncbi:MAG: 3-deoxy-D-manno-octulosonic acid transferase [Leptothrix sp. (in: Bacteria)]|nr:3-deoxy-D-manno-octulosonic acid transferase [Leptothrix sp. (in: b-proteobacteria)]